MKNKKTITMAMKMVITLFIFIGVLSSCRHGFSCNSPEEESNEMKEAILAALAESGQPSAACALIQSGRPDKIAAAGTTRLPGGTSVTTRSLYHIGSTTKTMTAVMVMKMVEEGKLQLTTTLGEVFPDMEMSDVYRTMDIKDLMLSRAGIFPAQDEKVEDPQISEYLWHTIMSEYSDPVEQRKAMTKYVLSLTSSTGSTYTGSTKEVPISVYSNAGWAVLGHCIETILGKSWEQAIVEMIFTPLGISNYKLGGWPDDNYDPAQPVGHFTSSGIMSEGGVPIPQTESEDNYVFPVWMNPAGGGTNIDIEGYAAYTRDQLSGLKGNGVLLSQDGYNTIHSIQARVDASTMYIYGGYEGSGMIDLGFGWMVSETESGLLSGAQGSGGTFFASMIIYPPMDMAFAGLTNSGATDLINDIIKRTTGFDLSGE